MKPGTRVWGSQKQDDRVGPNGQAMVPRKKGTFVGGGSFASTQKCKRLILGGGFNHCLFSPLLGEDSHFY